MRINRHDTNGTKPLLGKGELGYDDYTAGGDTGRVYVGTGTENIALAERLESNMMTKAQFNALTEERKANRAGSGFDEWGKHFNDTNGYPNVNQGMFTGTAYSNYFRIGYNNIAGIGVSKTQGAIASINGVVQNMLFINDNNTVSNKIQLPTAPTIYSHDTVLTAEQIASGVIKHADASNSGLIVNGKFDTDMSGWTNFTGGSISQVSGRLKTQSISDRGRGYQYLTNLVVGKRYVVEAMVASDGVVEAGLYCSSINNVGAFDYGVLKATISETTLVYKKLEFTAITTNLMLCCTTISSTGVSGSYSYFDNIAVYPADAISRSDLVFLESWHEDISEKNFVYPLGNTQYLGSNTDELTGIANGAFSGFETYSLFGNWQTSSALIGKGYVWSSLTEAQKRAFIANPENNCYLDGDKTIQVRYRVRVAMGIGDNWDYPVAIIDGAGSDPFGATISYSIAGIGNKYLKPKGKKTNILHDVTAYNVNDTGFFANKNYKNITTGYETGMATAIATNTATLDTNVGYEGKCFAMPIALVHR